MCLYIRHSFFIKISLCPLMVDLFAQLCVQLCNTQYFSTWPIYRLSPQTASDSYWLAAALFSFYQFNGVISIHDNLQFANELATPFIILMLFVLCKRQLDIIKAIFVLPISKIRLKIPRKMPLAYPFDASNDFQFDGASEKKNSTRGGHFQSNHLIECANEC